MFQLSRFGNCVGHAGATKLVDPSEEKDDLFCFACYSNPAISSLLVRACRLDSIAIVCLSASCSLVASVNTGLPFDFGSSQPFNELSTVGSSRYL